VVLWLIAFGFRSRERKRERKSREIGALCPDGTIYKLVDPHILTWANQRRE
jgi:hypothetical protein